METLWRDEGTVAAPAAVAAAAAANGWAPSQPVEPAAPTVSTSASGQGSPLQFDLLWKPNAWGGLLGNPAESFAAEADPVFTAPEPLVIGAPPAVPLPEPLLLAPTPVHPTTTAAATTMTTTLHAPAPIHAAAALPSVVETPRSKSQPRCPSGLSADTFVSVTGASAWPSARPTTPHKAGEDIEQQLTKQCLYKTELCRSFEETTKCRYGAKCQFAHGKAELRPVLRHPKYKTEICKTFQSMGSCPYSNRCRFIHLNADEEHLAKSEAMPPPPSPAPANAATPVPPPSPSLSPAPASAPSSPSPESSRRVRRPKRRPSRRGGSAILPRELQQHDSASEVVESTLRPLALEIESKPRLSFFQQLVPTP